MLHELAMPHLTGMQCACSQQSRQLLHSMALLRRLPNERLPDPVSANP